MSHTLKLSCDDGDTWPQAYWIEFDANQENRVGIAATRYDSDYLDVATAIPLSSFSFTAQ